MSNGLMIVDVQPAYHEWCAGITRKVVTRLNRARKPVVVMFVGEGFTSDTQDTVAEYLREHGASMAALERARFVEKDYGFYRSWMDSGVSEDAILRTLRTMRERNLYRSDYIERDELEALAEESIPSHDPLFVPSFDARPLRHFRHMETCGGGSDECLAEMELWLAANDINYARNTALTY